MKKTPKKEKKGGAGAAPLNDANLAESLPDGECLFGKGDQKLAPLLLARCTLVCCGIFAGRPLFRTGYLVMSDAPISEWSALLAGSY